MTQYQCFKIKRGTDYDKAVKEHFKLLPKWNNVFDKLSELLGEKITKLALTPEYLLLDKSELKNDEIKKLFTVDGRLKNNTKKAKQLFLEYQNILNEEGLSKYQELRFINFAYGVMRMQGQELESYRTSEDDIYYRASFDLNKKTSGLVEPITEIEYQEKYLEELKKQSA
jgi:hypothetical protein